MSLCVWDWCSSAYIHTPGRTGLEGINRTYVWFVRHHFYCGSSSGLFLICWNWFFLTWKQKDIGVNVIGKVRLSVEIHSVCKVIIAGRVKGFGWCSQWRSVCEGYSPPGMLRRLCIVKWKHVLGVGQRWFSGRVLAKKCVNVTVVSYLAHESGLSWVDVIMKINMLFVLSPSATASPSAVWPVFKLVPWGITKVYNSRKWIMQSQTSWCNSCFNFIRKVPIVDPQKNREAINWDPISSNFLQRPHTSGFTSDTTTR